MTSKKRKPPKDKRESTQPAPLRVAWVCLHLLIFTVPLAMSNVTWLGPQAMSFTQDQFDIVKLFVMHALTLAALIAWALWFAGEGRIRHTKIDWLIVVFIAWVGLTTITSIHRFTALFGRYGRFEGFLTFVNYAILFFLVVQLADSSTRIRSLGRTLIASATLVGLYGIMQSLRLDPLRWGYSAVEAYRAFSTFGNPDWLAGFLIFPLAIAPALALTEEDQRLRAVYWSAFLVIGVAWLATFVRGAWIGGLLALLLVGAAAWRLRIKLQAVDWVFFVASVACASAVASGLFLPTHRAHVVERAASILRWHEGSARSRLYVWKAALRAIRQRPIFGSGADTFRFVFFRHKPIECLSAEGYAAVAGDAHNYPLQIAATLGVPGLLLLGTMIARVDFESARSVLTTRARNGYLMLAGFWAGAAGYLVHLLFGMSVVGSTFLLWMTFGVLAVSSTAPRMFALPAWRKPVGWAIAAAASLALVGNVFPIIADHHASLSAGRLDHAGRVREMEWATHVNPFNDVYRTQLARARKNMLLFQMDQSRMRVREGADAGEESRLLYEEFLDAVRIARQARDGNPLEYDNYVVLADLYNIGGIYFGPAYLRRAVRTSRQGIAIQPYGVEARFQLARAYANGGQTDAAIAQLRTIIDMAPPYIDAHLLLGDIYRAGSRLEEAKSEYETALRYAKSLPHDRSNRQQMAEQGLAAVEASLAAGRH